MTTNLKRLFGLLLLLMAVAVQGQTLLDNQFNDVTEFENYTVIDQNEDYQTWLYDDLYLAASCPRDYDADDWLITPSLALEEGKTYKLSFVVSIENEGFEALDVMMGNAAEVSALNVGLMNNMELTATSDKEFSVIFKATATGEQFIGFHFKTPDDGYSNRLYLKSVVVEVTADQSVPGCVTNLTAIPGAQGALQADVAFTAPTVSINGGNLTSITKIEVLRDDQLVKTFENPAIGEQLSFTDEGMSNGFHTWRVVPSNEKGEGTEAEVKAYVGIDQLGPVTNLKLVYDHEAGVSTLTWDAPTVGVNGGYIDTQNISYTITRAYQSEPIATGYAQMSFEDEVGIEYLQEAKEKKEQEYAEIGMNVAVNWVINGQGAIYYDVNPVNEQGKGASARTNSVIIGEQYTLPFVESFADGKMQNFWRTDIRNTTARWIPFLDKRFNQDNDNGMMGFNAQEGGETATLLSGNLSMKDASSPVLMFYYFCVGSMSTPLYVKVCNHNGELQTIGSIDVNDSSKQGSWQFASIPLTGCAGQDYVQVAFETTTGTTVDVIYLDNLRIIDQHEKDLTVRIASAPSVVKVGEMKFMTAEVENLGLVDVANGSYTLNAYIDGKQAGTTMGMAVAAGAKANSMLTLQPTIDMQDQSELYVEVVYADDEVASNNKSEAQPIKVKMPNLPVATNLRATKGDGVKLTWDAPAQPRTVDGQVTESFEDYNDFTTVNFGEWQLHDGDMGVVYGLSNYSYPVPGYVMSYIVFNPSEVTNNATGEKGMTGSSAEIWKPRTGSKLLASFSCQGPCDDWLISPELSGNAQTISFYAHHLKSGSEEFPESFQLYISTNGSEVNNFMAYDQTPVTTTTADWKNYEYNLPQGTKHFAIRKVSDDKWCFMIDDITFAPDTLAAQTGAIFYGYNVYKNGTALNGALVSSPEFTDADGKVGDRYRVTAVYNKGEAAYSNEVEITGDGATAIESVATQSTSDSQIYDLQGRKLSKITGKGIIISDKKKIVVR